MALPPLDSHAKMAAYALAVLTKDGLMIPANQAQNYLNVTEWLRAIKEGALEVRNADKTPPSLPT